MNNQKIRYMLPETIRHYWSVNNLSVKFRIVIIGDWTDPDDNSVHHYVVTFDEDDSLELTVWEGITMDGEMRYEALAAKTIKSEKYLRAKARDLATWIFASQNPEGLPGVFFI